MIVKVKHTGTAHTQKCSDGESFNSCSYSNVHYTTVYAGGSLSDSVARGRYFE